MTSKPLDSKQTKPDGHGDGRGRHRKRSSTKEFASRKTNGVCSRRATRRMLQANGGSMDTTRMTSSITTSRQPWTEWRSSVLSSSTGTYNSGGGELLHRLSEERRSRYREGHNPFGESWYVGNAQTSRRFTSYERDGESGGDYAVFRYYEASIDRFT